MQVNQVKQDFRRIEQSIHHAARACRSSGNVPDELKNAVSDLEKESGRTGQMLQNEQNENRVLESIDRLEQLGDRARDACRQSANVDEQVKSAVQQAHDDISNLKRMLH